MLRFEMVGLRYDQNGSSSAAAGREVLHDISFHVQAGAFRWLLGPSGAGKTSMLRLLYLAVRPSSGRLSLLGTDVTTAPRRALPALRRRIGVVFQDFRLLPHLSTFDNVALPLRLAGRPEGQIRADVTELLRWVGLSQYLDVPPAALSGGEQQRVAIARAVITRPALLLADEPTGNLDDGQAERLMQLFKEMNRIGTTVIVATHNEALVARHPAPALRIFQGRLVRPDPASGTEWGDGMNRGPRRTRTASLEEAAAADIYAATAADAHSDVNATADDGVEVGVSDGTGGRAEARWRDEMPRYDRTGRNGGLDGNA